MKRRCTNGFTLIELILAIAVSGVVMAGICRMMLQGFSSVIKPSYTYVSAYGNYTYEQVPSAGQFYASSLLLAEFQRQARSAAAVFVLGGYRSSPTASATSGQMAPLKANVNLSSIFSITSSTNLRLVQNSFDVRSFLTTSGAVWESTFDGSDFTVLMVSGLNTVTAIVQVRRYNATLDGASIALYEVVLDVNPAVARDESATSASRNRWSYRIGSKVAADGWTLPAGALHYWFRYDSLWQRGEEGAVRLIFPDPYLLAGTQMVGQSVPFSRFLYFIPPTT